MWLSLEGRIVLESLKISQEELGEDPKFIGVLPPMAREDADTKFRLANDTTVLCKNKSENESDEPIYGLRSW